MAIFYLRIFSLIIGIAVLLTDIYLFYRALCYHRHLCGKCKGYLKDTKQLKDVYIGFKAGRFYKRYIEYVYVYRVDGKEYFVDGGVPGTKNVLRNCVDVIYQKKKPQRAYISDLYGPMEGTYVCLLCPVWLLFIICGIFM